MGLNNLESLLDGKILGAFSLLTSTSSDAKMADTEAHFQCAPKKKNLMENKFNHWNLECANPSPSLIFIKCKSLT